MLWTRSFNLKANAERQYAVLDPDLEIRGVGGGAVSKKTFFGPLGLSLVKEWVGGGGRADPSPVSTTDTENTV